MYADIDMLLFLKILSVFTLLKPESDSTFPELCGLHSYKLQNSVATLVTVNNNRLFECMELFMSQSMTVFSL